MTILASSQQMLTAPPRNVLAHSLLWLIFACSHVVLFEPAPYEFLVILAILFACLVSLQISQQLLPLIALMGLHLGSLILAAMLSVELMPSLQFAGISVIVYATTILLSIYIYSIPSCINPINHGYVIVMRGLMNIWSRGMDKLAKELEARDPILEKALEHLRTAMSSKR